MKCQNCGDEPAKAKGRCNACRVYHWRTGRERPPELVAAVWDKRAAHNARQIEKAMARHALRLAGVVD